MTSAVTAIRLARSAAALVMLLSANAACFSAPAPTPSPVTSTTPIASLAASPAPRRICPPTQQLGGAISGNFAYPSESAPPLAIYAIRVDAPTSYRVLHTEPIVRAPQRTAYTMLAVEPGTYIVVAYPPDDRGRPVSGGLSGSYTPAVACGLSVNCNDHAPIRVTVRAGQTTPNVDVLDWYAPQGTFPALPTGGEPFAAGDRLAICNPFADEVNLRGSPRTSGMLVRAVPNGTELVVTDGPRPADGYDWYAIRLDSSGPLESNVGWVVGYSLRR